MRQVHGGKLWSVLCGRRGKRGRGKGLRWGLSGHRRWRLRTGLGGEAGGYEYKGRGRDVQGEVIRCLRRMNGNGSENDNGNEIWMRGRLWNSQPQPVRVQALMRCQLPLEQRHPLAITLLQHDTRDHTILQRMCLPPPVET
jgi:hypothetical protein